MGDTLTLSAVAIQYTVLHYGTTHEPILRIKAKSKSQPFVQFRSKRRETRELRTNLSVMTSPAKINSAMSRSR